MTLAERAIEHRPDDPAEAIRSLASDHSWSAMDIAEALGLSPAAVAAVLGEDQGVATSPV